VFLTSPFHPGSLPTMQSAYLLSAVNGAKGLSKTQLPLPVITHPWQVLVKVFAASVNPLDIMMSKGYGKEVIDTIKVVHNGICGSDIGNQPTVLGRDFAGEVVCVGREVKKLKIGDKVWGATFPSRPGSHQHFCLADQCSVSKMPERLDFVEASSIPYAGITAWSAIMQAGLSPATGRHSRVLLLGASGGVGGLATQVLVNQFECEVIGVAAIDSHAAVQSNGASAVLDYRQPNFEDQLYAHSPYDLVLDCAGQGDSIVPMCRFVRSGGKLVTLTSPFLHNTDTLGLIPGTVASIFSLVKSNLIPLSNGIPLHWAFFSPSNFALETLADLVSKHKLNPPKCTVFRFERIQEAYNLMSEGHSRGKIIIDMTDLK